MRFSAPLFIAALIAGCDALIGGSGLGNGGDGPSFTCDGPPYPILLHHGFQGGNGDDASGYFAGVADDLKARGELVIETAVAPYQSSEFRGAQLADDVEQALLDTGA